MGAIGSVPPVGCCCRGRNLVSRLGARKEAGNWAGRPTADPETKVICRSPAGYLSSLSFQDSAGHE